MEQIRKYMQSAHQNARHMFHYLTSLPGLSFLISKLRCGSGWSRRVLTEHLSCARHRAPCSVSRAPLNSNRNPQVGIFIDVSESVRDGLQTAESWDSNVLSTSCTDSWNLTWPPRPLLALTGSVISGGCWGGWE